MNQTQPQIARVLVWRSDPQGGEKATFQAYSVPYDPRASVMDVLMKLQREQDASLAFRCSCLAGLCNVCLVKVNGKTVCACKQRMLPEMTIEPLDRYPVIRDLVVEWSEVRNPCQRGSGDER